MKNRILRAKKTRQDRLIEDIRNTRKMIEYADLRFQQETDSDRISSVIYEIQSLKAQHSYLMKLARRENVKIELFGESIAEKREVSTVG